jgi:type II secretory pathway component PulM
LKRTYFQLEVERQIQEIASETDKSEEEIEELRKSCKKAKDSERSALKMVKEVERKKELQVNQVQSPGDELLFLNFEGNGQ